MQRHHALAVQDPRRAAGRQIAQENTMIVSQLSLAVAAVAGAALTTLSLAALLA